MGRRQTLPLCAVRPAKPAHYHRGAGPGQPLAGVRDQRGQRQRLGRHGALPDQRRGLGKQNRARIMGDRTQ